jgi:hypothetical protein
MKSDERGGGAVGLSIRIWLAVAGGCAATALMFAGSSGAAVSASRVAARPVWTAQTRALVGDLAVLRRPQREVDRDFSLLGLPLAGVTPIRALMRGVRVDGREVYVIPTQGSGRLGSGLEVFQPAGSSCCVSVAALHQGRAFVSFGRPLWLLGVVPDGVQKVVIDARGRRLSARVHENVADIRSALVAHADAMTWYGSNGRVIKRLRLWRRW